MEFLSTQVITRVGLDLRVNKDQVLRGIKDMLDQCDSSMCSLQIRISAQSEKGMNVAKLRDSLHRYRIFLTYLLRIAIDFIAYAEGNKKPLENIRLFLDKAYNIGDNLPISVRCLDPLAVFIEQEE